MKIKHYFEVYTRKYDTLQFSGNCKIILRIRHSDDSVVNYLFLNYLPSSESESDDELFPPDFVPWYC